MDAAKVIAGLTVDDLIAFECRVADAFEAGRINSPVHLSGGNEQQLIDIFKKDISHRDWVFSNWRSHYHALLHGIDPEWLFVLILKGKSMSISSHDPKFFASSILGGTVPIATGVAWALKRSKSPEKVWVFIGDMAAQSGIVYEAKRYVDAFDLPLRIVVEDNGLSVDTPTRDVWGGSLPNIIRITDYWYQYTLAWPHHGTGKFVVPTF